jgi:hypothetical protein
VARRLDVERCLDLLRLEQGRLRPAHLLRVRLAREHVARTDIIVGRHFLADLHPPVEFAEDVIDLGPAVGEEGGIGLPVEGDPAGCPGGRAGQLLGAAPAAAVGDQEAIALIGIEEEIFLPRIGAALRPAHVADHLPFDAEQGAARAERDLELGGGLVIFLDQADVGIGDVEDRAAILAGDGDGVARGAQVDGAAAGRAAQRPDRRGRRGGRGGDALGGLARHFSRHKPAFASPRSPSVRAVRARRG